MSTTSSEVDTMVAATAAVKQKVEPKSKAKAPTRAPKGSAVEVEAPESAADRDRLVMHIGKSLKRCILEAAAAHSEAAAGVPVSQVDLVRIAFARAIVVKDGKATVRPIDPSMVDVANEKSFSVRIFVPRAAKVKASISEIAKGMSQPGDLVHPVKAARIAACAGLMIDKATKKAVLRPPMIEGATTSRSL